MKKNFIFTLGLIAFGFGFSFNANSQCSNDNSLYYGGIDLTTVGENYTEYCLFGGEYLQMEVTQGNTYTISTCGSGFDTQITLYNSNGGSAVGYNDDACGLQSEIVWTASFSGTLNMLVDKYNCQDEYSCAELSMTLTSLGGGPSACDATSPLTCGVASSFSLASGAGSFNPPSGPWGTPGNEAVFTYTPTATGSYTIAITNNNYYVDLFYQSGSCESFGWTFVDDIFSSGSNSVDLTAGVTYYFLVDDENTTASSGTLSISCPALYNPCDDVTSLDCETTGSFSLASGGGAFNPSSGPWGTPGNEAVFSFTATETGTHTVAITNNNYYVDLFWQAGSCGSTGWNYVNDIFTSESNGIDMIAGVTYFLLVDDENTTASSGTITVTCPVAAVDPCTAIVDMTCDLTYAHTLGAGEGLYNPPSGPWGTPGQEVVYSYTPSYTGSYTISMTNSGYYSDIFVALSCEEDAGWQYITDVFSSVNITATLISGTTYYFLIDDENTSPSTGTLSVSCPCIPPAGGINGSLLVDGNVSYSGNTSNNCNQCDFRSSNDEIVALEITCPGTYTITTCGGASWDTYLYLSTQPCGGSLIALNDDACGLQSSITATLGVGTYYVSVEAYSSFSSGAFTLNVSKSCDLSASASSPTFACGNNVSCNGSSDGMATVSDNGCGSSYSWSNGATTSTANGLAAGDYNVTVSDAFGCSADASVTLTEPSALSVNAGADETVYWGYDPESCADLSTSHAQGGCAPYTYNWSGQDGGATDITVCPTSSTTYTMTATDANGCTASDDVTVCVIDVRCWAGNSNNQKVQVCHNFGDNNPHTICVDASAVPAHLAHGDVLGSCDEVADCGPVIGASGMITDNNSAHEMLSHELKEMDLYPNPATDELNVVLSTDIEEVTFTISNALGQVVYQGVISNGRTSVNTSSYSDGVYYMNIEGHIPEMFVKK